MVERGESALLQVQCQPQTPSLFVQQKSCGWYLTKLHRYSIYVHAVVTAGSAVATVVRGFRQETRALVGQGKAGV